MTDEERLEELLDRWEQTREPGVRLSPEEVCRDCPDLLEGFRRRVGALARVDGFLKGDSRPPAAVAESPRPQPSRGPGDTPLPQGRPLPAVPGYQVLEVLGEGGMGVVYKARQQGLNRLVALKMVRRDFAASTEALARFRAEAEAVARLQHPHVVAVHAWGEHDGVPFFALEFCAGGSLHDRLRGRPQPPVEAARLVEKLARAVQAAHEAGIIHRDLKPSNVLLTPPGDEPALNTPWGIPKVGDFGLCRCPDGDLRRTREGAVLGSPLYMAPEQAEGRVKEVGPPTDVWALGVILYELLTGSPPFEGPSLPAILHAVCSREPPRPGERRPGVPAGLESICLRCLRKPPAERYGRAVDLAADLRAWLAGQPAEAVGAATGSGPELADEAGCRPAARADALPTRHAPDLPGDALAVRTAPLGTTLAQSRRAPGRGWLAAAGLLLAGLAGLGALAWWSRTAPEGKPSGALPSPEGKPLSVDLQVSRVVPDGLNRRRIGDLGKSTFRVRRNEGVEVEAKLSEPAYAYLIAFNPASDQKPEDQEQPVPLAGADRPPEKRNEVDRRALELDDGEGLQALAVVASRQPLPPYTVWKKIRPPLGWRWAPATSGVVWRADGVSVQGFFDDGVDRARELQAPAKTVIRELARKLKEAPGIEAVEVVGFAVDRLP